MEPNALPFGLTALFLCLVSAPASGHISYVRVLPDDASDTDSLLVHVQGAMPDGCWEAPTEGLARLIETNIVLVDLYAVDHHVGDAFCASPGPEYDVLIPAGHLKPGTYLFVVSEHHGSMRDPQPIVLTHEMTVYATGSTELKNWKGGQTPYGVRYGANRRVDNRWEVRQKSMPDSIRERSRDLREDLDGDGLEEVIQFSWKMNKNSDRDTFLVRVNEVEYRGTGNNLAGWCFVQDIDSTDAFKELAIPESGPSDDYAITYLYYDGAGIHEVGTIPGYPDGVSVNGSGRVVGERRGSILQTWYYPAVFELNAAHRLTSIPQGLYPMYTRCVVSQPFPLVASPEDPTIVGVPAPGDSIMIVASDDARWCLVELATGQWGWFEVVEYDIVLPARLPAHQLMQGLSYAD